MQLLSNAFSLNMVTPALLPRLRFEALVLKDVHTSYGSVETTKMFGTIDGPYLYEPNEMCSVIGHADTANVVSDMLGKHIAFNRETVLIDNGNTELFVAQYTGPRLEEGATTLPAGSELRWVRVYFEAVCTVKQYDNTAVAYVNGVEAFDDRRMLEKEFKQRVADLNK